MDNDAPWHAHIYYDANERAAAEKLRQWFEQAVLHIPILFVGRLVDSPIGPHPMAQFEIHFPANAKDAVTAAITPTGLRALIHPLTDDDLADHTSLAQWIGEPLPLDVSVLDPPGTNQGVARFGKSDF